MEVEDFLAHHGVKGMKWGVVNNDAPVGKSSNSAKTTKTESKTSDSKPISSRREAKARKFDARARAKAAIVNEVRARPTTHAFQKKQNERLASDIDKVRIKAEKDAQRVRDGKLTSRQRNLLVGAGVAVAIVGAYGAYKYVDSGQFNVLKNKGAEFLTGKKFEFKKNNSLTGDLSADDIFSKVVRPINPNYGAYGTKMNCRRATFAYEMRRRGYDVKATLSNAATGQTQAGLENAINPNSNLPTHGFGMYKGVIKEAMAKEDNPNIPTPFTDLLTKSGWGKNTIRLDAPTEYKLTNNIMHPDFLKENTPDRGLAIAKSIFRDLDTQPDASRGELGVGWTMGGGHSMSWEKIRGKIHIYDNQSGEGYHSADAFKKFAASITEAGFTRLDNVQLNEDFLQRWVTNV